MTGDTRLERSFLPLDQRPDRRSVFFRLIGLDGPGASAAQLRRFYQLTQGGGLCLRAGLDNPAEPETARFFDAAGAQFALSRPLVERHLTVWLGQLRPAQRQALAAAVLDALELLKAQGANENIIRNAYIKFMCWFRAPFGKVVSGIGKNVPPKILFEGEISRYALLLLHILHRAGCDVWYVHFTSEASYQKAARGADFSQLIQGSRLAVPERHFAGQDPPVPRPASPTARPAPPPRCSGGASPPSPARPANCPPPWAVLEDEVILNTWVGDRPVWEAVLLPRKQRGTGGAAPKLFTLFALCFGGDERGAYRNRLFHLKRKLDGSGRRWLLLEQKPPAPTVEETQPFRAVDKGDPDLTAVLAQRLALGRGRVPDLLAQRAFTLVMQANPERDPNRRFNYGVRLACWLRRYGQLLFSPGPGGEAPALVRYGPAAESEAALLWALAQMGADVLLFSPDPACRAEFQHHFLPHHWMEVLFDGQLPLEPFPQREEKLRASTTAYNASRELDHLLYSDTGMFRDRQFTRSQPVTLKTTYDEVGQLWREEAQYRPSFRTDQGVVYVPNLFAKISGVDKGDAAAYWEHIRGMVTEDTYLVTQVPFLQTGTPTMTAAQARGLIHNGRLDPKAVKASSTYQYDHLPDDTQDYILEKIQALMDYDLITGPADGLPAAMLCVLMNLDKELLRLLQNFDFTRSIPKFLIVDVTEHVFTREECILLAFLNLVGFDIAVFTPTGYRNLEKYLRPDSFDTLTLGEFLFDLTVPDLRGKRPGGWLGRLFGG